MTTSDAIAAASEAIDAAADAIDGANRLRMAAYDVACSALADTDDDTRDAALAALSDAARAQHLAHGAMTAALRAMTAASATADAAGIDAAAVDRARAGAHDALQAALAVRQCVREARHWM